MSTDSDHTVSEDPTPTWRGYNDPAALTDEGRATLTQLADASRGGDWATVFSLLDQDDALVNACRPGGRSGYAPLHQAAYHGDADAAAALVRRGAFLALRTASGERACDVARRKGHDRLAPVLTPPSRWAVPSSVLRTLELYLHAVIRVRADELVTEAGLRLPPVEPLTGMTHPRLWFPIPGMYGGFSLELLRAGDEAVLQADSWCRVASGSEERHLITARGVEMVRDPWGEPST